MRIAICDDDESMCRILYDKVKKYCGNAVIEVYRSGDELLAGSRWPDVLFLDIQMPGKNGMETARDIRKRDGNMILIFITAVREQVFEAFDVNAFHYLVKPFTEEKFVKVLSEAIKQKQESMISCGQERGIIVKVGGTHIKIKLDDIIYAEVYDRKIIVHKRDGDIAYYGRMAELQAQAGKYFVRPHRAYLVNLKYVVKYDRTTVYMEKGTALMAKKKYPEFVKQYLKYIQEIGEIETL